MAFARALPVHQRKRVAPPIREAARVFCSSQAGSRGVPKHVDWADFSDYVYERFELVDKLVHRIREGQLVLGREHTSGQPLHDKHVLMIQHQMGSHCAMVRGLFALGLQPSNTWSVDTPYTAQDAVLARLHSLGVPQHQTQRHEYTLAHHYDTYQQRRVGAALRALAARAQEAGKQAQVVVLDDGAYVLSTLHNDPALHHEVAPWLRLGIVEQTMRGIIKLRANRLAEELAVAPVVVPLVDMARCATKKLVESRFIGENAVAYMMWLLRHEGVVPQPGQPVLVTGYGAIGRGVAVALADSGCLVFTSDPDPRMQAQAAQDGVATVDLDSSTSHDAIKFELVVGCSGVRSFGHERHHYDFVAPHACFASASSGNHELNFDILLQLSGLAHPDTPVPDAAQALHGMRVCCRTPEKIGLRGVHHTVAFDVQRSDGTAVGISVLNGGFPVTFIGRINAVPAAKIQPTIALLVGSAAQAGAALDEASDDATEAAARVVADSDDDDEFNGMVQPLGVIDEWMWEQSAHLLDAA